MPTLNELTMIIIMSIMLITILAMRQTNYDQTMTKIHEIVKYNQLLIRAVCVYFSSFYKF